MYQALVRITRDEMPAATPPVPSAKTASEGPRFDWATLLDGLLRRMRDVRTDAANGGKAAGLGG